MKKIISLLIISIVVLISCKKEGCMDQAATNYDSSAKKEGPCNYTPMIVLNGTALDTVDLGATYNDLGATATIIDGSTITVVVDDSQMNTDSVHTFQIIYTASNEHGNVSVSRDVSVVLGTSSWLGTWNCSNPCDALQFPLTVDPNITFGGTSDEIVIDNVFNLVGGTIIAYVQDEYIVVPEQTIDINLGEIILDGLGTMNSTGTQFVIDYNYNNTTPFIGGTGTCQATYDK